MLDAPLTCFLDLLFTFFYPEVHIPYRVQCFCSSINSHWTLVWTLFEQLSSTLCTFSKFWLKHSTPMEPGLCLSHTQSSQNAQETETMCQTPYLSAVGALLYLATTTRPDIAYTVGILTRFNSNPGWAHWLTIKHLLWYIKCTLDYAITYSPDPSQPETFITFSDADHGVNIGCLCTSCCVVWHISSDYFSFFLSRLIR